mmetsp:Transcript_2754/g.8446  ORF Transcript_2754/g.8446 Transcript_2754/m.8446 type:complete len:218 (+) Transcript_2754:501-1154(+)
MVPQIRGMAASCLQHTRRVGHHGSVCGTGGTVEVVSCGAGSTVDVVGGMSEMAMHMLRRARKNRRQPQLWAGEQRGQKHGSRQGGQETEDACQQPKAAVGAGVWEVLFLPGPGSSALAHEDVRRGAMVRPTAMPHVRPLLLCYLPLATKGPAVHAATPIVRDAIVVAHLARIAPGERVQLAVRTSWRRRETSTRINAGWRGIHGCAGGSGRWCCLVV